MPLDDGNEPKDLNSSFYRIGNKMGLMSKIADSRAGKMLFVLGVGKAALTGAQVGLEALDDYVSRHTPSAQVEAMQTDDMAQVAHDISDLIGPSKAIAGQGYNIPTDSILERYMSQTVEQTLEGTGVVYVNDSNFQHEVMDANQPTMVLFYAQDSNNPTNEGGVNGLAALTRVLADNFPQIKVCAYEVSERNSISPGEFGVLQRKYPFLQISPTLAFFDNDGGRNEFDGTFDGGISNVPLLIDKIGSVGGIVQQYLLD